MVLGGSMHSSGSARLVRRSLGVSMFMSRPGTARSPLRKSANRLPANAVARLHPRMNATPGLRLKAWPPCRCRLCVASVGRGHFDAIAAAIYQVSRNLQLRRFANAYPAKLKIAT